MNTGASWPSLKEAVPRVLAMQTKLHRWAVGDPDRRFDDLYNLVYDPAFLVVAHQLPTSHYRKVFGQPQDRGGVDTAMETVSLNASYYGGSCQSLFPESFHDDLVERPMMKVVALAHIDR